MIVGFLGSLSELRQPRVKIRTDPDTGACGAYGFLPIKKLEAHIIVPISYLGEVNLFGSRGFDEIQADILQLPQVMQLLPGLLAVSRRAWSSDSPTDAPSKSRR